MRADAAWTPGPGWQDVSSPALLELGLHRILPDSEQALDQGLAFDPRVISSAPEQTIEALDSVVTPNDAGWPLPQLNTLLRGAFTAAMVMATIRE